jgi:hypothetical protein
MIRVQPARGISSCGLGTIVTTTTTSSQPASPVTTALIFGGVGLLFTGFLALQFYKASKGIQDTYIVRDHHGHGHGPSIHFDF